MNQDLAASTYRIIASRNLSRTDPDGTSYDVRVEIEEPRPKYLDHDFIWLLRFSISNLNTDEWIEISGIDAIDAILNCLNVVSIHLAAYQSRTGATITWFGDSDVGFPLIYKPPPGWKPTAGTTQPDDDGNLDSEEEDDAMPNLI